MRRCRIRRRVRRDRRRPGGQEGDPRSQARRVHLAPGARAAGRRRDHRVDPRSARACLSQRRADRGVDLLDRKARPLDADRRVHDPEQGSQSPLLDLQQRADAEHEPADLVGHRAARRQSARLSGLARLHPPAARILAAAVRGDACRNAGDHRRQSRRSVDHRASGPRAVGCGEGRVRSRGRQAQRQEPSEGLAGGRPHPLRRW